MYILGYVFLAGIQKPSRTRIRIGNFGRGGGDRKDKLLNKACALNALHPPPLFNWNKRNRRRVNPPWAYAKRGILVQF